MNYRRSIARMQPLNSYEGVVLFISRLDGSPCNQSHGIWIADFNRDGRVCSSMYTDNRLTKED
jgi:hypothetical protein